MQTQEEIVDDQTKQFYRDRTDLVEQDGWRDLIEELSNLEKIYNNLDSIESERDLWFAKGQLSILRQVLSLEDTTRRAVEELDL
ncbi:MAG: hypothetical protein QF535_06865 [Anaerolineales bacterium]|jgi:hypothetical protein|nr:hypothetical protein [Anaerolineales bacterium]|tara:strand:+ start:2583 stop:2834 length:252 start_codon:yes stop_codon:yes gene_type:complete